MRIALDTNVLAYASVVLASSADAECRLLLSQDLPDGLRGGE